METGSGVQISHPLDNLDAALSHYLSNEQVNQVKRAYFFAEQAHYGQKRRSGEDYITHPLAVAFILANMHMDHQALMAAMLHDVIEDTGISKDAIAAQFGETVADLVDGVSKLTKIEFASVEEKQAENFQKMTLAMARDIRVILVKLADRLHNMRTLGVLKPEKRRRIARETLDIYAPIAMRLGMNDTKSEFEDLGFAALYPMRSRRLRAAMRSASGNRKALIEKIQQQIETALEQDGLEANVQGREKHLYSLYRKMREKRKSFTEIMDIYAFRIVVDTVDTCYRVLGCVHSLYKPVPGEFSDYIAIPKTNGYQSLHTVLKGMHGVPIEIQIRTREMEAMANNGIAAHWLYKTKDGNANASHERAREWVKGLLEMQQRAGSSLEFIESVKFDLFPDEIYVFSPKGTIYELPQGATAVDFAYAVHTDLGNTCTACRINKHLSPLSEPLQSGQTVEILANPQARPDPSWINYAVTAKARSNILHYLKHQTRDESISLGKSLLDKALTALSGNEQAVAADVLESYLSENNYLSVKDLYNDIARGKRLPAIVAKQILGDAGSANIDRQDHAVAIRGTEGFVVTYGKCCRPIPGDAIVGYLSDEKGVVVHRDTCSNLGDLKAHPNRKLALRWDEEVTGDYMIDLRIETENLRGIIAVLATKLNRMGVNIERISTEDKDPQFTYIYLSIKVQNRVHLARIMKHLRAMTSVRKVLRRKN
ncbi:MAG: bifunctional GTP diphosphokinase/guanosine-3',5'-bis(diphosphate) 3'-diphosphatase [Gammaproteobacteria bacterium]|nr:MAG: bifunctional GTP diphosphokinase/guanosine-3',5'-bis(diphosphate) 3'-diphosphatase [Gammaproteobacteria bacterium]